MARFKACTVYRTRYTVQTHSTVQTYSGHNNAGKMIMTDPWLLPGFVINKCIPCVESTRKSSLNCKFTMCKMEATIWRSGTGWEWKMPPWPNDGTPHARAPIQGWPWQSWYQSEIWGQQTQRTGEVIIGHGSPGISLKYEVSKHTGLVRWSLAMTVLVSVWNIRSANTQNWQSDQLPEDVASLTA